MVAKGSQLKEEAIDRLAEHLRARLPEDQASEVEPFVRAFYSNVPPDDILDRTQESLWGAALSLWTFSQTRAKGEIKVRAYNPEIESHGWQAGHTVVEAVTDDMPFLVDSVKAALSDAGLTVHLIIHPMAHIVRGPDGQRGAIGYGAAPEGGAAVESLMHFDVDERSDPAALQSIERAVRDALTDVRCAVEDWRAMLDAAKAANAEIDGADLPVPATDISETRAFLEWIADNHFTFVGYRELEFVGDGDDIHVQIVPGSGLGILRDDDTAVFDTLRHLDKVPPEVRQFVRAPTLLLVNKANRRSRVHRPVYLDTVMLKRFDAAGHVVGERLFVGLFTSVAYSRSAGDIPFLREKVRRVLDRSGFSPDSHDMKALEHILEHYPRDELFQISEDELLEISHGILDLQERQRTALFLRRDPFERFITALVYIPRDRFDTALRRSIAAILEREFNGEMSAHTSSLGEDVLARVYFIIKTDPGHIPDYDAGIIEHKVIEATRSWADHLVGALTDAHGEARGLALLRRFQNAFPTAYQERFSSEAAVFDITRVEEVLATGRLGLNLYHPLEAGESVLRFKVYHRSQAIALSDILPVLEHMGLRVISEVPFEVKCDTGLVWIHDFTIQLLSDTVIELSTIKTRFQEAFYRIWTGTAEDDGFNRLVLAAGLDWREVAILRAYAKFLRQARFQFSQDYLEDTLASHPALTKLIVRLFECRHTPSLEGDAREADMGHIRDRIEGAFETVENLDEDRILRRFVNLVLATLRTNAFQPDADGAPKPYISFKLDSQVIEDLPLPRPMVEIFVYSPRVEGVHLRGGKVARGGLRWSDRREDFRTEILGLMKAQMVKNAVIVPVGAKGGFVVKRPPPASEGREAWLNEGIGCYQIFMRGLLDISDNLAGTDVIAPENVVRHDGDDPYLVVAADKGTATFSDIANGVARDEYGFWLDDAFASGGSAGYDHKKMGITARGAWESVKRHFREIGKDCQNEDFTTVGVGDMGGDVFGNGMLLSKHIRLIGAFNHLHIFIDPDPDAASGWEERKRLFEMPRSSWTDYDKSKISRGGGIFDRKAKSLTLTPEIKARLGIERDRVTPNQLIRALLRAQVELMWFGGIGTYVKAEDESHADVGDKANDVLRLDATALRCKIVGEGANLGLTQAGRIEFARNGGRLNTDFIDNSAGVDCSDHEVNIKILLRAVLDAGDMTMKQRDVLLERMTDEVADLVLVDNYQQTQALTVAESEGAEQLDAQGRLMRTLERAGILNRAIEGLPDDEALTELSAHRQGLTRPELSVILSYAKIAAYEQLLPSPLPDEPYLAADLAAYFPGPIRDSLGDAIGTHRLGREIVATKVTNSIINRMGPTFMFEMTDRSGMAPADVARAYLIVRDSFGLRAIWRQIEALDNKVPATLQTDMIKAIARTVERTTGWVLRYCAEDLDVGSRVAQFKPGIEALTEQMDAVIYDRARDVVEERVAQRVEAGVPENLARHVASLNLIAAAFDLQRIAEFAGRDVPMVAPTYFEVGQRLGLAWLRDSALRLKASNHWQKQALQAVSDDLYALQADLTQRVLAVAGGQDDLTGAITAWTEARAQLVERIDQLIAELKALETLDLSMLVVTTRRLRGLMAG